jgi:hypothetical protein
LLRAVFFGGQNARGAIHVALHEMTAETRTGGKSAFEIHAAFAMQGFQVCAIESFFQEIEGKLVIATMGDRQAATVHRDAVADLDSLCDKRGANFELRAPISCMNPEDTADFFNQAGKHELIVHRLTQIPADFVRQSPLLLICVNLCNLWRSIPEEQNRVENENWRQRRQDEFESGRRRRAQGNRDEVMIVSGDYMEMHAVRRSAMPPPGRSPV